MRGICNIIVFGLCFTLIGCASKVERPLHDTGYHYTGEKYSKVEMSVSPDATDDPNDRVRFDEQKLCDMIERKLEVSGLINTDSSKKVKVEITDVRIRSSFNAVMWGVMAGNDHIEGDVTLIGDNGEPRHTFSVSASYALGGFAGGVNETRMGWLFEEFSELALAEITGNVE